MEAFKNTNKGKKAWELIKSLVVMNLKKEKLKFLKHIVTFSINNGKAKSADIEKLIEKVKKLLMKNLASNSNWKLKL